MPTRTFIDDTLVRVDTPVTDDLSAVALEFGESVRELTQTVLELAAYLDPRLTLDGQREELERAALRFAAIAGHLERDAATVRAIRDKANGEVA